MKVVHLDRFFFFFAFSSTTKVQGQHWLKMIHFPQRSRCTFQNVNRTSAKKPVRACVLVCLVPCCFLSHCYSPLSRITIINGALLMIKIVYVHSFGLLPCSIGLCSLWCVFLLDLYAASNSAAGPTLIGLHQAPFQSELIQPFKKLWVCLMPDEFSKTAVIWSLHISADAQRGVCDYGDYEKGWCLLIGSRAALSVFNMEDD